MSAKVEADLMQSLCMTSNRCHGLALPYFLSALSCWSPICGIKQVTPGMSTGNGTVNLMR